MALMETERLVLRRFTNDDKYFILALLNSPKWLRFIGDRQIKTLEDAEGYLTEKLIETYDRLGFGFYMVQLKNDGTPIGMCGLVKRDGLKDVDIGYAFLPTYEGKGYALEAAKEVLTYGLRKLSLQRIVAITDADNLQSISLLHKLKFHFEKLIKLPQNDKELMLFAR